MNINKDQPIYTFSNKPNSFRKKKKPNSKKNRI
jgi:hypothetical protein